MNTNQMLTLDSIRDIQIYQNKNGYRFSIDALLLFSFVNLPRAKNIVDLGAGSGIIGILLAKKYPDAEVVLVELQKSLAMLAEKNAALNNLADRVKVVIADVKRLFTVNPSLFTNSFDLVVSNPPFRKAETGHLSIGDERAIARHEIKMSLRDLIRTSALLLRHHGRLIVIYLPERLTEIMDVMRQNALEPKRIRFVHSNISSEAKMVLIEAVKGGRIGLKIERPLLIYNEEGYYSDEIRGIYAL